MRCSRCHLDKPDGEFSPSAVTRRGPRGNTKGAYCRPCRRARYAENIEVERARSRERSRTPEGKAQRSERGRRERERQKAVPELRLRALRLDRSSQLMRDYGIGLDEYERRSAMQGYKCGCCGTPEPETGRETGHFVFHVDHDHATGQIRGLLCRRCNTAIGMLGDTRAGVLKAAAYLQQAEVRGSTIQVHGDLLRTVQ